MYLASSVLSGRGFSESEVVVDLDSHEAEDRSFEDYGYESDSDLDSEDEEEPAPPPKASPSSGKSKPASGEACNKASSPRTAQDARMGRVIVLKDTAFKTYVSS
jgi:hypothetical protein